MTDELIIERLVGVLRRWSEGSMVGREDEVAREILPIMKDLDPRCQSVVVRGKDLGTCTALATGERNGIKYCTRHLNGQKRAIAIANRDG